MGQPASVADLAQAGGRRPVRLIARLDVKGENLIKGIHLEGLRRVGSPVEYATRYYAEGIDEILFMDVVASLYGRAQLLDIVRKTAESTFVPLTVGGGVRTVEDFEQLLRAGADKVALNTAALKDPSLVSELAARFGSQSVVLSVEARRSDTYGWEALTDNGRERSGRGVLDWAVEGTRLGAGEVLVTSVDREGTRSGFDVELVQAVASRVSTPVVGSGGMGTMEHFIELAQRADVSGIAMADVLHFNRMTVAAVRAAASEAGIDVREHVH